MDINNLPLPNYFTQKYQSYVKLHPIQEKSISAGLLNDKSLLVCAPTASGKTFVASMAIAKHLGEGKAIYVVPLRALANEKFKEYQKMLEGTEYKVVMSTGDIDSKSGYLANYDLLILTSEKLDSLIRHKVSWLSEIKLVVIDEIHLLNDKSRGPTLEIIITLLKRLIKPQIVGLSATIGNPNELADWMESKLVEDDWRPVKLHKGISLNGKKEFFYDEKEEKEEANKDKDLST
jgi:helicase